MIDQEKLTQENKHEVAVVEAPEPKSFALFLSALEDGRLHDHLSQELQHMADTLYHHAMQHGGKPKGSITLKLEFKTDESGIFEIMADVKTSEPKLARPRSIMWSDEANNLVPHNPRQMELMGIRDVTRQHRPIKQL